MKSLTAQLEDHDDGADMTPMIDCVFLLLLFFIVTATFSEETLFEIELPEAAEPLVREGGNVVEVYVLPDGGFSIGSREVTEEALLSNLRSIHERHGIKTLRIKGDKRSDYENVIRVVDIAQTLRTREFSLAVERE